MPTEIDRNEVRKLTASNAQLVEVLPPKEYAEKHLAAARSIPLEHLTAEATADLRRDQPVIVYCHDYQ
jgi:rhodanese-related sulfurtransferase